MNRRITADEAIALGGRELFRDKPEPVKKKRASRRSNLERDLGAQLIRIGLNNFETDYRFHSVREWKFDFAFIDMKFAIEVDGTIKNGQGGHQTVEGMTNDYQKQCEAMLWGWTVLRCTAPMVKSGEAADYALRIITRMAKVSAESTQGN